MSLFEKLGSNLVAIPQRPPAFIESKFKPPPLILEIVDSIGIQLSFPETLLPGPISISSPTLNCPDTILPPIIPPCKSLGLVPGLFTSNDLATYNNASSLSFLSGVGITFSIVLIKTSKLTSW